MPNKIGDRFNLFEFREMNDINSKQMKESFGMLADFLSNAYENPITAGRNEYPYPGCMMLPPDIREKDAQSTITVVPSGTAALVLTLETEKLPKVETDRDSYIDNLISFHTRLESSRFKRIIKNAETHGEQSIYIKVVTAATGKHWDNLAGFRIIQEYCLEDEKYNIHAYHPNWLIISRSFGMLLMHDAGVPIQGNYMGFEDFCREYYRLMVSTENIADDAKVIHGDIHRHNILFCAQQNRISLVDWDESTLDEALDREVTQQHNKERYPEKLKEDGKAFTMVQLFICFRDFISDEYDKVLVYASEGNIMGFVDSKSLREEVRIDLTDYNSNSVEKIYRCLENKLREM